MFRSIIVYGLGLLGGSVCKALKAKDKSVRIVACGRTPDKLTPALDEGAVDAVGDMAWDDFRGVDLVIVATPVIASMDTIAMLLDRADLQDETLVIDVGSVKEEVVKAALGRPRSRQFIGCHPMAGSEKTGYNHSSDVLYENASVIVTPHGMNRPGDVERIVQFWKLLGARTAVTTPELHDRIVAMTSHLPHVVAGALADALSGFMESEKNAEAYDPFIGNGFRDTTRIAAGSPDMWRDIVLCNRDNLDAALAGIIRRLERFRAIMGDGDELHDYFEKVKRFREGI